MSSFTAACYIQKKKSHYALPIRSQSALQGIGTTKLCQVCLAAIFPLIRLIARFVMDKPPFQMPKLN